MNKNSITKTALAEALQISRQAVHRYEKQGMPCDSIAAAKHWRGERVRLRVSMPRPPSVAMLIRSAHAMQDAGALLLGSGNTEGFVALAPSIRLALRMVPSAHRPRVGMNVPVIKQLAAEFVALLEPIEVELRAERMEQGLPPYAMTGVQATALGEFWYEAAAGERQVN